MKKEEFTALGISEELAAKAEAVSGKVVTVMVTEDTAEFSEEPAGILKEVVDVTYGAQLGAFLVEGYVIGERLPLGVEYTEAVGKVIHASLPEIKFVKKECE